MFSKTRKTRTTRKRIIRRRRVARKSRFSGGKLINKTYKYSFKLQNQFVIGDPTGALVKLTPSSIVAPLILGKFSTPIPANSALTNYYDFGASAQFTLADISNAGNYTALYDNYKIDYITVNIEYLSNAASVNGVGILPSLYYYVDQDDSNTPSNVNQVAGKQGSRKMEFGNKNKTSFRIKIRPKVSSLVTNTTSTSNIGFMQGSAGWQDSAYPDNVYYGLKLWFENVYLPPTGTNTAFKIQATYNVSFKGALRAY